MTLLMDVFIRGCQMSLLLVVAPLIAGVDRKIQSRLLRRRGPSIFQPYYDLWKLTRKDTIGHNDLFYRIAPYLIFAATWLTAALVPTFAGGLSFSGAANLIAIFGLLTTAHITLALASKGSFGGASMLPVYSGYHLALIEIAGDLRFALYISIFAYIVLPFGMAVPGGSLALMLLAATIFLLKLMAGAAVLAVLAASVTNMRVFRVNAVSSFGLALGLLAVLIFFAAKGMK